jgi:CRISPR-associated protein Cas2
MLVMTVTECPAQLRGELTRWLLEIRPHVYVGHVNARIRDQLWRKACEKIKDGSVLQIWNTANEQGFTMRSWNEPTYRVREFEGVLLVERPAGDDPVPIDETAPDGQRSPQPPRGSPALDGPVSARPPNMPNKA